MLNNHAHRHERTEECHNNHQGKFDDTLHVSEFRIDNAEHYHCRYEFSCGNQISFKLTQKSYNLKSDFSQLPQSPLSCRNVTKVFLSFLKKFFYI